MATDSSQALTKKTIAGFKWSYLSTFVQGGLQFATFTILAHLLSPREFGIVGMATIFTNFIERVGFLGVGQALVQREKLTDAHVRCAFVLCLLFGISLFLGFYFAAPFIAAFFDEPALVTVLRVISMSFVLACVSEVPLSLLQRELRFKQLMLITNTSFFIGSGLCGITLAVLGYSYWALVTAIVVGRFIRLILSFRARPQKLSLDYTRQDVRDLLGIGVGFSLGRLTNYCALVGDNFVTGKVLGAQALGLYSRSYQLMTAPATYFGQVLEKVFFAALSQKQNEKDKIMKYHLYGIELSSMISGTGAVLLTIAAPEVVTVLFGHQWLDAVPAVKILAFGVFFRTCYKNSDTVIRALGKVYSLALRQTMYAALVVGGALLGSRWGIEGVACAVLFAVFFNYAVLSYLCGELIALPWSAFGRAHLPALWIVSWQFVVLGVAIKICHAHNFPSYVSLAILCALDGLVSLIALWLAPTFCQPKVFRWLGRNLNLERFGRIGRIGKEFFLREASAPSPAK